MKIILFANSFYPLGLVDSLLKKGMLAAVVSASEVNPYNKKLEESVHSMGIPFKRFSASDLQSMATNWIQEMKPDLILVFTFGYKIPVKLLDIPRLGWYNVHFSLLPKYRGIAPLFWQIKSGDKNGGVTVHKMDGRFDTGPIVASLPVDLYPGETQGFYASRLSFLAVDLIVSAIETIENKEASSYLQFQNETDVQVQRAPGLQDLMIDWAKQSAGEIINLINACNPACGGAVSIFRGQMIRIMEATLAMLAQDAPQHIPGTIVFSDPSQGVFVQCIQGQFLRLNVIEMAEGTLSGFRMATVGVRAGEVFESILP